MGFWLARCELERLEITRRSCCRLPRREIMAGLVVEAGNSRFFLAVRFQGIDFDLLNPSPLFVAGLFEQQCECVMGLKICWIEALSRFQLRDGGIYLSGACQQHSEIEAYCGVPGIQHNCVLKCTDCSVRVLDALIGQSQEIKTLSILWLVTQVL